ncbi:Clavaminate synthase-like protein [Xylaria sp. CBS 124048]|nr:Clavaminate synthase-like protein [Xylaria sp. CBS 124048]
MRGIAFLGSSCAPKGRAGGLRIHQRPGRFIRAGSRVSHYSTRKVHPVTTRYGAISVDLFHSLAWKPALPAHLRDFHHLPAMKNWFTSQKGHVSFGDKLIFFADTSVNYELITASPGEMSSEPHAATDLQDLRNFQTWLGSHPEEKDDGSTHQFIDFLIESMNSQQTGFQQFEAPLRFIIRAQQFNGTDRDHRSRPIRQLYVAQHDIRSLPPAMAEDLPEPGIVTGVGRGDVYSSSIWLGLQPTYTSLHRDPNPNLFCQLVGRKVVRLLPPSVGLSVYQQVRRSLGEAGNPRFRGPEMMVGPERDALRRAVWADDEAEGEILQAELEPGDALFIPMGWWHSVASVGDEADLNASANWWFR